MDITYISVILYKEIKVITTKRMVWIIPVGLLVGSTIIWMGLNSDTKNNSQTIENQQIASPEKLFSQSNHIIWQMVREGNVSESSGFNQKMSQLKKSMDDYNSKGFEVKELSKMLELYHQDGSKLADVCFLKEEQLQRYYEYEQKHEQQFILSLEQIGLPELMNSYKELEKIRQEYYKNPAEELLAGYKKLYSDLYGIITELYLDSDIEDPLFDYLKNHENQLYTIAAVYNETGKERIVRIRDNSYKITTQLQLLPKL